MCVQFSSGARQSLNAIKSCPGYILIVPWVLSGHDTKGNQERLAYNQDACSNVMLYMSCTLASYMCR